MKKKIGIITGIGSFILLMFFLIFSLHDTLSHQVLGFSLKKKVSQIFKEINLSALETIDTLPLELINREKEDLLVKKQKIKEENLEKILEKFEEDISDPLAPACL